MKHKNIFKSKAQKKLQDIQSELAQGPRDDRDEEFYNRLGNKKKLLEEALGTRGVRKKIKKIKSAL